MSRVSTLHRQLMDQGADPEAQADAFANLARQLEQDLEHANARLTAAAAVALQLTASTAGTPASPQFTR